jgi:hypothetical protein
MARGAWLLVLMAALGCGDENRLEGPNHDASGPPWIADGVAGPVAALEVEHRVLLIGDAGLYLERDPTLAALSRWAQPPTASSVVFLGDNIYDDGLIEAEREEAERILGQQLAATAAPKVFLPGNHDWGMNPKDQNVTAIRNQQQFIEAWPEGGAEFLPRDGCMGPDVRVLGRAAGRKVVLVALDPTPWISPGLRGGCPEATTPESHLAGLAAALAAHAGDFVIVASHYPMRTGGPHGGLSYGFVGDLIVGVIGWYMGSLGNVYEPAYAEWIAAVSEVMRQAPPLVYAAGHDHSLQVLDGGDVARLFLVSGAGAPERVSTVTHLPESLFAHAAPGFMAIDFGRRGAASAVVLRVIENGSSAPVFEIEIERP